MQSANNICGFAFIQIKGKRLFENQNSMIMNNSKICYKCLLEELDEKEIFRSVQELIAAIPPENRTEEGEYRRRLEICRGCDSLISGTCKKCGCYVELRAAGRTRECPDTVDKWR